MSLVNGDGMDDERRGAAVGMIEMTMRTFSDETEGSESDETGELLL